MLRVAATACALCACFSKPAPPEIGGGDGGGTGDGGGGEGGGDAIDAPFGGTPCGTVTDTFQTLSPAPCDPWGTHMGVPGTMLDRTGSELRMSAGMGVGNTPALCTSNPFSFANAAWVTIHPVLFTPFDEIAFEMITGGGATGTVRITTTQANTGSVTTTGGVPLMVGTSDLYVPGTMAIWRFMRSTDANNRVDVSYSDTGETWTPYATWTFGAMQLDTVRVRLRVDATMGPLHEVARFDNLNAPCL